MMKFRKLYLLGLLLAAACSTEVMKEETLGIPEGTLPADKILNSPDHAAKDCLVVLFNEEAAEFLENNVLPVTKSGAPATRSGLVSVDAILAELDIVSLERVFPADGRNDEEMKAAGLHRWYLLNFGPSQDAKEAAEKLATIAEVSNIQYSMMLKKAYGGEAVPATETKAFVKGPFNDPSLFWQWNYINNADLAISNVARAGADINVAPAWELTGGDPNIIVAVVDEGVKYTHPDLAANIWTNPEPSEEYGMQDIHGYNFVTGEPISWDKEGDTGHATHIAGTIAAVNNNGVGVCGIAGGTGNNDGVRIMSCQIFSGEEPSTDVAAGRAITYAANHGASIIQCSYGYGARALMSDNSYEQDSPLTYAAIKYFMSKKNCDAVDGGMVFFSAGNEGEPMAGYPAAYKDYIAVTAFGVDGLPTDYTNFGPGCNIAAPGGEMTTGGHAPKAGIMSTLCSEISKEDYGYMQGTSMACPHATGVAALGMSYALKKGKTFTREEFNAMVLTSVHDIDSDFEGMKGSMDLSAFIGKMGTGAIDAYRLLMQVEGTPCLNVPVGKMNLIPLTEFFGESAEGLTYTGVEISDKDMEKLGITVKPYMYEGKLLIKCGLHGSAKIKVSAIAGGQTIASGGSMGGMEITKEFAILARSSGAANGGWL